jgi:hypothetical protein
MSIEELPEDFYYMKTVLNLREMSLGIQVDDSKINAAVNSFNMVYLSNYSGMVINLSLQEM